MSRSLRLETLAKESAIFAHVLRNGVSQVEGPPRGGGTDSRGGVVPGARVHRAEEGRPRRRSAQHGVLPVTDQEGPRLAAAAVLGDLFHPQRRVRPLGLCTRRSWPLLAAAEVPIADVPDQRHEVLQELEYGDGRHPDVEAQAASQVGEQLR